MPRLCSTQQERLSKALKIVFTHAQAAVYIKGSDGRYELVNPRFAAIAGLPPEEIVGKTDSELSLAAIAPSLGSGDRHALASGTFIETEDRIALGGEERIFVTTRVPIQDGGEEIRGVCGLLTDITHIDRYRRAVEAMAQGRFDAEIPVENGDPLAGLGSALAALSGTLEDSSRQTQRLREIGEERARLLGTVAHDLRNPLTVIDTYATLLLEGTAGGLNEEQRTFVELMGNAAGRMRSLIEGLLDARAVELGRMVLDEASADLTGLLGEVIERSRPLGERRGIGWELELGADTPPAWADPVRLGGALDNLVSNAVKFSPPGATVTVGGRREAGGVRIFVADRGPGFSPAELDEITGEFRRGEATPASGERGFGLGLFIVRRILAAHGTSLEHRRRPGGGTELSFRLPAAP